MISFIRSSALGDGRERRGRGAGGTEVRGEGEKGEENRMGLELHFGYFIDSTIWNRFTANFLL